MNYILKRSLCLPVFLLLVASTFANPIDTTSIKKNRQDSLVEINLKNQLVTIKNNDALLIPEKTNRINAVVKTCRIVQPQSCDGKGGVYFFWNQQGADCVWNGREENQGVSGTYTEYDNGTASLTGNFDRNGSFNISLSGRTLVNTPHFDACNTSTDVSGWYYFTGISGTIDNDNNCFRPNTSQCGISQTAQVGLGASTRSNNSYGIAGWWQGTWCGGNNPNAADINFDLIECVSYECTISSISLTPTECNPINNQYELNGIVNFANQPTTGDLIIQMDGISVKTIPNTFVSPLNFNIPNLVSDGLSHTITATFSDVTTCTNSQTFTAPNTCLPCSIVNITATPNTCNAINRQNHDITGVITVQNPPLTGGLNIFLNGILKLTLSQPLSNNINYTIPNINSDGNLNTIVATFVDKPNCSGSISYLSPAPLTPPTLEIVNNVCPQKIGEINVVEHCGTNSIIEYSINNGNSWSISKPLYSTIPMNILVRCKSTVDNNCYGSNNTFTTDPIKCTNNNPLCTLSPTIYIDPCNNNNTDFTNSDDFFTIQASASIQGGNHPQRFEVVVGADPFTGLGGNVLNSGGTVYNSTILLGQNKIFKADGTSLYKLIVRDLTNNSCFKEVNLNAIAPCSETDTNSPCFPKPCVPIRLTKN